MSAPSADVAWVALGMSADGWEAVILTAAGSEGERRMLATGDVATWVRRVEASHAPRWIWSDTDGIYRRLLAAGVRVARCHDLRLAHAILRSPSDAHPELAARADPGWDAPRTAAESEDGDTLFSLEPGAGVTRLPQAIMPSCASSCGSGRRSPRARRRPPSGFCSPPNRPGPSLPRR